MIVLCAFFISVSFGMIFGVPRRALPAAGLIGALGYAGFLLVRDLAGSPVLATFAGASAMSLFGETVSRLLRRPAIIFVVPAFVPLLPGAPFYRSMRFFVEGKTIRGSEAFVETLLLGGALALGILLVATLFTRTWNLVSGRSPSGGS